MPFAHTHLHEKRAVGATDAAASTNDSGNEHGATSDTTSMQSMSSRQERIAPTSTNGITFVPSLRWQMNQNRRDMSPCANTRIATVDAGSTPRWRMLL
jgi:hypothetical protein